jgi:hypothetical protein
MPALVVAAIAVAALGVFALSRKGSNESTPHRTPVPPPSGSILLIVQADPRVMMAVIHSSQGATPAAVAVPAGTLITIPGQGDGTAGDAGGLPGTEGATAISNLLGVWIDHAAVLDAASLAGLVDRAGGLDLSGGHMTGKQIAGWLSEDRTTSQLHWQEVLGALLDAGAWKPSDFLASDDARAAAALLTEAKGATVDELPATRASSDALAPDYDAIGGLAPELGGTATPPVPVIVLNGSGRPGVGESVAAQLVPGGYRVVFSGNASSFDHETTLIVAGTNADRAAADRIAKLLGVGEVSVSGLPSGLGDVTIVMGKDYRG